MTASRRYAHLARGTLSHWAATGANILYALIVTPIVVAALGSEQFGIWSFVNGLLAYSSLLSLGLGAAMMRFGTQYRASGDVQGFRRLFSVVLSVYLCVGLVSLAASGVLALNLGRVLATPLAPLVERSAQLACLFLGARIGLMIVASTFSAVLWAHERPDMVFGVPLAATLLRTVLVPLAVRSGQPLTALAVVFAASTILEFAVLYWLALREEPTLRVRLTVPSAAELKLLYGYGLQSFFVQVALVAIAYTDSLVIGVTLGATAVALYSLPLQLVDYGKLAITGILAAPRASLTRLYVQGRAQELRSGFLSLARLAGCFAACVSVNLACLGPAFLELWVGREFSEPARSLLVLLGATALVQTLSIGIYLPFYEAIGDLREPAKVLAVEGLLNVGLSLVLVRILGLDGVALGTFIPSLAVSTLLLPRRMNRRLGVSTGAMVRHVLLPTLLVAATSSFAHIGFNQAGAGGYLPLLGRALTSGVLGVLAAGLVWPRDERSRGLAALRTIAIRFVPALERVMRMP